MTTAEDVFYLYERNNTYYHNCNISGTINDCPDNWSNECFCHTKQLVKPITIGNQCVPCAFKRKCYIKIGEECSICMDQILTKSSAYLTSCGHSFHKLCIFKAFEIKQKTKHASNFTCPNCRTSQGMDIHEINERYNQSRIFMLNYLDNLENFWITKDFILTEVCSSDYKHDIGMKNDCNMCLNYRETGNLHT